MKLRHLQQTDASPPWYCDTGEGNGLIVEKGLVVVKSAADTTGEEYTNWREDFDL